VSAQRLPEPAGQRLVLELSGVDFFDSSGLNELLRLGRRPGAGAVWSWPGMPPMVQRILSLTGADTLLPV
jgi:anti-anti-sigma regulatory factor